MVRYVCLMAKQPRHSPHSSLDCLHTEGCHPVLGFDRSVHVCEVQVPDLLAAPLVVDWVELSSLCQLLVALRQAE